jgi:putative ABC transport system permease protein
MDLSKRYIPLSLRFALRELRGGLHGFYIFLACLSVGVAAIAGAGSLGAAITGGMRAEGQAILGGDVALELNYRDANAAELAHMQASGAVSLSRDMRAMVKSHANDVRTLIELKAVDAAYPLFGAVTLRENVALQSALAQRDGVWGAVIEGPLAERLNAKPETLLRIGAQDFEVRGIIVREPDRASGGLALGPRAMVAIGALDATQLVQPGSLQVRHYRIKLHPGADLKIWLERLNTQFPDAAWRVRDRDNSAPSTRQFLDQMAMFLTLTGLTALVVGGVGAGNAVHGYLQRKRVTIATLKCLGAGGGLIFRIYLTQIFLLACLGIAIGLGIGIAIPFMLATILADLLPVPAHFAVYPLPLVYASTFGLITAVLFAIWPLARAREISAAALFRELVAPVRRWPRPVYIAATVALTGGLAGLAFLIAGDARFAFWFVTGIGASFIVLRLLGAAIMALARSLPAPPRPELRLALANLHRPGSPAPAVLLSLGLGLCLLVTIAMVEGNINRQVTERASNDAPAFFFLDIQSTDIDAFRKLANGVGGVSDVESMPTLRGRIVRIKDRPATIDSVPPEARWALRGDRNLSFAVSPPEHTIFAAGEWWPPGYAGPPLLSLDARLATDMGLGVGDTMTVNVLGRDIEARIANLRSIDWSTMGVNFALIFSPGLISSAPHSYLATARATQNAETPLHNAVTDQFPGVSVVRVRATLETVNGLLNNLAMAVRAAGAVTLVTGMLVLAGALAAGHGQRVYDAVLLKVLGATRARVVFAYAAEYALLGLTAAGLASLIGTLAAYMTVTYLMHAAFVFLPATLIVTLIGTVFLTIFLGLAITWRALGQKAATVLRGGA